MEMQMDQERGVSIPGMDPPSHLAPPMQTANLGFPIKITYINMLCDSLFLFECTDKFEIECNFSLLMTILRWKYLRLVYF